MIHVTTPAFVAAGLSTRPANREFSYDTGIRAEVAQYQPNFILISATVASNRAGDRRLFLFWTQSMRLTWKTLVLLNSQVIRKTKSSPSLRQKAARRRLSLASAHISGGKALLQ
jgi:hypothetical protein